MSRRSPILLASRTFFTAHGGIVPLVLLILAASGCGKQAVYYYETLPPEADVADIERIAVADFQGLERSGRVIALELSEGIVSAGTYELYERSELDRILQEHELAQNGLLDPATVHDLRLAGIDALIFGLVDAYSIDQQTGVEKVERQVNSGRTRTVERENEKGEIETVEEEVLETILVERPYVLRQGTLTVSFRLADVHTGRVVAIRTDTAHFSRRAWRDQVHELPGKDQILDQLAGQVCRRFLQTIHPRTVAYRVDYEENEAPSTELGISYARNGLWEEAYAAFRQAARERPADPSVHYNVALTANALGHEYEAEQAVQRAIALEPRDRYMRLLSSIRRGDWAR